MDWDEFVSKIQIISVCVSLLLNLLLILLIVKKSPAELGSYRYLMIYTSLFEICYSIMDVLISPMMYSQGSMLLVIVSAKNSIFSKPVLLLLICVWGGLFGAFMMIFCIQFIYRYFVVIESKAIKNFKSYRIIFWVMIPVISGTMWGTIVNLFIGPKEQDGDILRNLLLEELDLEYEEVTYIGPRCYYTNSQGDLMIDTDSMVSIAYFAIVMVISLSCIFYCATKTFLRIRETLAITSMDSSEHTALQSQAFYALVTQAIIPVILMHFPCSYVLAAAILDIDLGHASGIVSVTFALFPALDPLPVMLIIKNYRGTLFNVISTPVNIFVRRQVISKEIDS